MRNSFSITIALLLSALPCLATGNYSELWQKGNNCYQQKQYDSAAFYYEQLAALKPQNAEIYYNLGDTYYRLNKIGFAVLNYERALKINPDYKEAKDNLMLAKGRISNPIPTASNIFFIRWWEAITNPMKATTWAVSALIIFALFFTVMLIRRIKKTYSEQIPVQVQGVLIFIFVCLLGLSFFSSNNSVQNTGAVVMENDVPLMNNDLKGKPITLVPEGTTVKIKSEKGDWVEVFLPDGRIGWLRQNHINKI